MHLTEYVTNVSGIETEILRSGTLSRLKLVTDYCIGGAARMTPAIALYVFQWRLTNYGVSVARPHVGSLSGAIFDA